MANPATPLPDDVLPAGIRSRFVQGVNGLTVHVLEAGYESPAGLPRPCVLLLHGFPELAYSWRKVMVPLADAGFHVIAPDQRGYGRTTGWDGDYDGDLTQFRMLNLVRDALALISAFGHRQVHVVGHDFGSPVAAWCALTRPDVFRSVVLMSAPFEGAPTLPFDTVRGAPQPVPKAAAVVRTLDELATLPRPRQHYQWYYSTRDANPNMHQAPQGVHDFLRAYYHHKSADWPHNRPHPLAEWRADELAKLPTYYVMDAARGMAETVAAEMPSPEQIAACEWLPDRELAVYSAEYGRTGFQGGLQWYRCATDPRQTAELTLLSGRTIDVPSMFVAGSSDWGTYQNPGAYERMQRVTCTQMRGCHLVDGAGHWVQQEQPERVSRLLIEFLAGVAF
jgi:pimeloyl-ACP methyl ester carboxylesterase